MTEPQQERTGWTIEEAEALLLSLKGVTSVRLVTRPGGDITEVHVLTTEEVSPKQTVRNVESALQAHYGIGIDHRKISVAQSKHRAPEPDSVQVVAMKTDQPGGDDRLLFVGHRVETERSHRVRHRVQIRWRGERYEGEASAPDLGRARLEAVAQATLAAVEHALQPTGEAPEAPEDQAAVTLEVDGVKMVDAFDRTFVIVAVHAFEGRDVTSLAGTTLVEESPSRAAIMATLQATDRWVRGRV